MYAQRLLAALALVVAVVTVGLTASPDGLFTIGLRPAYQRLGIDLDVKFGSLHLHAGWSALAAGDAAPAVNQTDLH